MLQLFNVVLFWVFAGLICAWIAPKKGRHPVIWFALGVLFSVFAVGLLLVLPPVKKHKVQPKPTIIPMNSEVFNRVWFYLDQTNAQQGPVDFIHIAKSFSEKQLSKQSYVWAEGMENWEQINDIPEVVKELKPGELASSHR